MFQNYLSLFLLLCCCCCYCCQELLEMRGILFITNSFLFFFKFPADCESGRFGWVLSVVTTADVKFTNACDCRMPRIQILLTNTKVPRSTKTLVANVRKRHDKVGLALTPAFHTRGLFGLGILFLIFLNKIFGQIFCVHKNFRSKLWLWVINCSAQLPVAVQWNCCPELCFVESHCCCTESSKKWFTLLL